MIAAWRPNRACDLPVGALTFAKFRHGHKLRLAPEFQQESMFNFSFVTRSGRAHRQLTLARQMYVCTEFLMVVYRAIVGDYLLNSTAPTALILQLITGYFPRESSTEKFPTEKIQSSDLENPQSENGHSFRGNLAKRAAPQLCRGAAMPHPSPRLSGTARDCRTPGRARPATARR